MADKLDIERFKGAVERYWQHHAPSHHLLWKVTESDGGWRVQAAPVYQEVVGGEQDGMNVWAGFRFDLSGFLAERGVLTEGVLAASYCTQCNETPHVALKGTYFAKAFDLEVHLEPIPCSAPVEVIDTINHRVRPIGEK